MSAFRFVDILAVGRAWLRRHAWAGTAAILAVATARFIPVIIEPGRTFADSFDGRGTLSYIHAVGDSAARNGAAKVLKGDLFEWDRIGLPDEGRVLSPVSVFWKGVILGLGRGAGMTPEAIYDAVALLAACTAFLAGYLLFTEAGASRPMAWLAAFVFANLDNFSTRVSGHLFGLGAYGAPALFLWTILRYAKRPSLPRALVLAATYVLSFQVNEYNTYFGTFVAAALLPAGLLHFQGAPELRRQGGRVALQLGCAAFVILAACALLFPNLLGARLFPSLYPAATPFTVVRQDFDYGFWTIGNPLSVFQPSPELGGAFARLPVFRPKHHEASFRLGLFVLLALGYCLFRLRRDAPEVFAMAKRALALWAPAIGMAVLLGISIKNPISLARFTMHYAPLFRVSARSFLFVDIGLLALFARVATLAWGGLGRGFGSRAPLLALTALAAVDATGGRIFSTAKVFPLPPAGAYAALAPLPDRILLELPHESGPDWKKVDYERYYFFARAHGKRILNNRADTSPRLARLGDLNRLDASKLAALKALGVGYVSAASAPIPGDKVPDFSYLDQIPSLRLIADDGARRIYELP